MVDKEILFPLVIHDPTTPPTLLWVSWAEEEKNQLQPEKGRVYLFSASQLPCSTQITTKNRDVHFQLLILWKNNDKKLVGVEHANKKEKKKEEYPQTKPRKLKWFIVLSWEKSPVSLNTGWKDI